MSQKPPSLIEASTRLDLLMPLQYFYAQRGWELPELEFIDGAEMPEPFSHLLVHESDMTPRLRAYHQSEIGLEVVEAQASETYVIRLVVLHRQDTGAAVEFGAIGIQLDGFSDDVRRLILSGAAPLGGILEAHAVPHQSQPKGYFEIQADRFMAELLGEAAGETLYGRCNTLSHPDGTVFADIVEILPRHGLE